MDANNVARRYRALTGRPLGIMGEVSEAAASQLWGLSLAEARPSGYDAVREEKGLIARIQIKGRCLPQGKPSARLRVGSIKFDSQWDTVVLVLMNEGLEVSAIYEAGRAEIMEALKAPRSKTRDVRGQLPVGKFRSIRMRIWPQG
jgi:hypothetical protein